VCSHGSRGRLDLRYTFLCTDLQILAACLDPRQADTICRHARLRQAAHGIDIRSKPSVQLWSRRLLDVRVYGLASICSCHTSGGTFQRPVSDVTVNPCSVD